MSRKHLRKFLVKDADIEGVCEALSRYGYEDYVVNTLVLAIKHHPALVTIARRYLDMCKRHKFHSFNAEQIIKEVDQL